MESNLGWPWLRNIHTCAKTVKFKTIFATFHLRHGESYLFYFENFSIKHHKMASKKSLVLFLVPFLTVAAASEESLPHSQEVLTQNGPIQGILKEARGGAKYVAFKGLRFANPAVRFQAAEPLEEQWTTPKLADTFGSVCAQGLSTGSDDCLFLNVYVPEKHLNATGASSKLPVMAYIHGGGFLFGEGSSYGVNYFMESEDVILVTMNYRLGVLGFMSTGDNATTSNLGLRDQVMALRWIKDNIAAFNGNTSSVTIFGESAGAACVHFLLMSPEAEGLFHKAIIQSGTMSLWGNQNSIEATSKLAKSALVCENVKEDAEPFEQSVQIRKCLETMDLKKLLLSQLTFWKRFPDLNNLSRFTPTAEVAKNGTEQDKPYDSFFAGPLDPLYKDGHHTVYHNKVPVIIGVDADEGTLLFASAVLHKKADLERLNKEWDQLAPVTFFYEGFFPTKDLPEISEKIKQFYFGNESISLENKQILADIYTDIMFLIPSLWAADEMARDGMSVFPYIFSYWGGFTARNVFLMEKDIFPGKVGHGDEVQYLFSDTLISPKLEAGSEQEEFSKSFVRLWASFAKQGEPKADWKNGSIVDWQPIQPQNGTSLDFEVLNIDREPSLIKLDESIKNRVDFWRNLIQKYASNGK